MAEAIKVNPHLVFIGDVIQNRQTFLDLVGPCHVIHTDPPWNQRVYEQFYRLAATDPPADYETLRGQLLDLYKALCPTGLWIVYQSVKGYEAFLRDLPARGIHTWYDQTATYGPNHTPCMVWVGSYGTSTLPEGLPILPPDLHDQEPTDWLNEHYTHPHQVVVDPCVGIGLMLRKPALEGRVVAGAELIPKKGMEFVKWLRKHCP